MSFGVVIVNYNSARLALDAALSVLGDDPTAKVVIVDNASTDDSLGYLRAAAEEPARHRVSSPDAAAAPPNFKTLASGDIGFGGAAQGASIIVLPADRNAGFAAGCNLGVKYLMRAAAPDAFLLLNPDAVLGASAIAAFKERLRDPRAGLCGATVRRFEAPSVIQALGGAALNPVTLLGTNIGAGPDLNGLPGRADVERQLDYPLGAALAFNASYITEYGLLDERFFLYYEEADWARRSRDALQTVWASGAVVYHRHGAAAGSRLAGGGRSVLADYHMARSRVLYSLKWRPALAPLQILLAGVQSLRRLLCGRPAQARAVIGGALSALSPAENTQFVRSQTVA